MTRIGDWTDEKVIVTNTPRGPDDPRHDPQYREKIRAAKEENQKWLNLSPEGRAMLNRAIPAALLEPKHSPGLPEDCPVCIEAKAMEYREKLRTAEIIKEGFGRLETDSDKRKEMPIYSGVIRYFPDALAEIAKLSKIGNDKHNPGQPLHWSRGKSTDHLDCVVRHLAECGTKDTDDLYHDVKVAWRALANLQVLLEKVRGLPISPGSKSDEPDAAQNKGRSSAV